MALMREDSSEREDAVDALGASSRPEAVELLRLALEDADEDGRESHGVIGHKGTRNIKLRSIARLPPCPRALSYRSDHLPPACSEG